MMARTYQCPFCECCEFESMFDTDPEFNEVTASLCPECGELLVLGDYAARKPTDDEYTVFGGNPLIQHARRLWMEMQRDRDIPMPLQAIKQMVADIPPHLDSPLVRSLVEGAALIGAATTVEAIRLSLEETNGYDEFFVALRLLEHDINVARNELLGEHKGKNNVSH
jgi:hypothetical protein